MTAERDQDQDRHTHRANEHGPPPRRAVSETGSSDTRSPWRRLAPGFAALVLLLLVIYGPGIGHGFVKDDVAWIATNHVSTFNDLRALAARSNGFYRPLVAASFAIDRAVYGLEPFGYGLTNLLLLIGSAAALAWMARGVGLTAVAAVLAAAIWALNLHGIHMAVLWLSGRTELWLTLCAFISAGALVRNRPILAGIAALGAMLAKEEAVMLPLMLAGWAWVLSPLGAPLQGASGAVARDAAAADAARADTAVSHAGVAAATAVQGAAADRVREVVRLTWPAWIALAVYLALRSRTGAYTPGNTPWFYQFTLDLPHLITNAGEYLDRACTFSSLAVFVAVALAWRVPSFSPRERRLAVLALLWLIGGYALTLFLPVRSSLYACFPSAGVAIFAAALIDSIWMRSPAGAARRRLLAAIALPVLLVPVYWSRNERWVELADLGADTFAAVRQVVRETPDASHVPHLVFQDDRGTRRSLLNTYGALLPTAVTLAAGRPIPVWLEPPPDDWRGSDLVRPTPSQSPIVRLTLRDERLVRVP